jgi:hypothetical protein
MSPGANRWLVRLRDSGRVRPNPIFQQSYAFTKIKVEHLVNSLCQAASERRYADRT